MTYEQFQEYIKDRNDAYLSGFSDNSPYQMIEYLTDYPIVLEDIAENMDIELVEEL